MDIILDIIVKKLYNHYIYKVMTDKSDKDQVVRQVYYAVDTGFGSIAETYRDAKKT